ncbi:M15 family metallopeptidase [Sinorhizobium meliloti]|uniref:M15 family metallopeptidase n=1 Tax=Rhizobium meliloti TaxID=382 RepID=UPI003D65D4F6
MHRIIGATLLLWIGAIQPGLAQSGKSEPIPDQVWSNMQGRSWHPSFGCPSRDKLVLLTVPYHDFSGQMRLGQLVVAKESAEEIVIVFDEIFKSDFRIERMELIDAYGGNDNASMEKNNTSAFNCRLKTNGKTLSAHSFGTAIDINPIQNPYVSKNMILPKAGENFARLKNRTSDKVGVIVNGGAVTTAFMRQKWQWGGSWKKTKDYQHFSKSGD